MGRVFLQDVSAPCAQMGERIKGTQWIDAAIIKNFLIFDQSFCTVADLEVSSAPEVNWEVIGATGSAAEIVC